MWRRISTPGPTLSLDTSFGVGGAAGAHDGIRALQGRRASSITVRANGFTGGEIFTDDSAYQDRHVFGGVEMIDASPLAWAIVTEVANGICGARTAASAIGTGGARQVETNIIVGAGSAA